MRRSFLFALLFLPLVGCVPDIVVMGPDYMTFEHEFTDKAAQEIKRRAERICGEKKQAAEEVSSACSLTRCTTSYQCVNPATAVDLK